MEGEGRFHGMNVPRTEQPCSVGATESCRIARQLLRSSRVRRESKVRVEAGRRRIGRGDADRSALNGPICTDARQRVCYVRLCAGRFGRRFRSRKVLD